MSYDVSIEIPIEKEMLKYIPPSEYWDAFGNGVMYCEIFDCGDITSNVGDMYEKALGIRLPELDGFTCEKAHPILVSATESMEQNPDDYLALEDEWTDYHIALKFLWNVLRAVSKSPKNARIRVSA